MPLFETIDRLGVPVKVLSSFSKDALRGSFTNMLAFRVCLPVVIHVMPLTLKKIDSSEEIVGGFRLWQLAK